MGNILREKRVSTAVITAFVLVVVLFNLPDQVTRYLKSGVREMLLPLQQAVSSASVRISEAAGTLRGLGGILQRNRELEAEVARLRRKLLQCEASERQNVRFRELLGFMQEDTRELLPCEIIGRDISGWWNTVRINKGRAHGVSGNMAVVTSDGLLGKTVDSSEGSSDVLLVSDPGCRVSALLIRTETFGIVRGKGGGWTAHPECMMDYLDRHARILPGDKVVTSGLGGVFPKGVLIGSVEKVEVDRSGLYQVAHIVPATDLAKLEYAFVVAGGSADNSRAEGEL